MTGTIVCLKYFMFFSVCESNFNIVQFVTVLFQGLLQVSVYLFILEITPPPITSITYTCRKGNINRTVSVL